MKISDIEREIRAGEAKLKQLRGLLYIARLGEGPPHTLVVGDDVTIPYKRHGSVRFRVTEIRGHTGAAAVIGRRYKKDGVSLYSYTVYIGRAAECKKVVEDRSKASA